MSTGRYPKQPFLGRTYRKRSTSLDGARSFLAGQNLIITASDRNALAAAGGRIWLRPSSTRRLGNFLDMTPPMIGGWTIAPDPVGNVFSAVPGDIYDKFVDATGELAAVAKGRNAALRSPLRADPDDRFDHRGVLTYHSLYTIEGGERLHHEPDVPLYLRRGDGRVHVMAIMRRDEEKDVVRSWLNAAAGTIGLLVQPFRLKEDLPERHDELRAIFKRLGDAPLRFRHPEIFQQEGGKAPASGAKYHEYRRSGSDRTWMVDIDTVLADADEHNMRIGAIRTFLFAPRDTNSGRDQPSINELRLHQEPGHRGHASRGVEGRQALPRGAPGRLYRRLLGGTEPARLDRRAEALLPTGHLGEGRRPARARVRPRAQEEHRLNALGRFPRTRRPCPDASGHGDRRCRRPGLPHGECLERSRDRRATPADHDYQTNIAIAPRRGRRER